MHTAATVWVACFLVLLVAAEGIHLPLIRTETPRQIQRRDPKTTAIGLGDSADITYNVLLTIGGATTPLLLDTGSSDLWVISSSCTSCQSDLSLYPQQSFQPTSPPLPIDLLYGDSYTGTYAEGQIGYDTVQLAGLGEEKQYFAAIDSTNTSVLKTGSTGIFGLGFPLNSYIWNKVFKAEYVTSSSAAKREVDYKRAQFPSLSSLYPSSSKKRQSTISPGDWTLTILSSYLTSGGPFLSRLALSSSLSLPMFSISLQRDSLQIGGNAGILSVGSLPNGVKNDSFTWVPLRAYNEVEGGLTPPTGTQEAYPLTWEVFIDDVYLDGVKLPRSSSSSPSIALSALLDTGNSLIRGPRDVINHISTTLSPTGTFPCSQPHTLAFSIGGKLFPIDPRDFVSQAYESNTEDCLANLAVTDDPVVGEGYLYSWSLGDPFLRSVISAYYFGNITFPSHDPPRMGFLSTVPDNVNELYTAAIEAASGGNFPYTTESAPTGLPTRPTETDSNGVAIIATATASDGSGSRTQAGPNAAGRVEVGMAWVLGGLVFGLALGLGVW